MPEAKDHLRAAHWCILLAQASSSVNSRVSNALLSALVDAGHLREAEEFIAQMVTNSMPIDSSSFQLMFERCVAPANVSRIHAWLECLSKLGSTEHEQGLIGVIKARSHTCQPGQAEEWLTKSTKAGLIINDHVFSAMIQACARTGDAGGAEKWLDRMIAHFDTRSSPHIVHFTVVMSAYAQKGEVKDAERVFSKMRDCHASPEGICYGTMIKACAANGNFDESARWAAAAAKSSVHVDHYSYNAVIAAATRLNQPETAENWLRRMEAHSTEPDIFSYNSAISAWANCGNVDRAALLLGRMVSRSIEPDVVTLTMMIQTCAKAHDHGRAESVFKLIVGRGHVRPNAATYTALVDACIKGGNLHRADVWLMEKAKCGFDPCVVTFTTLLQAHARAGDLDAAGHLLDSMHEAGVKGNLVSYSILIHACSKGGKVAQAEKWFHEMCDGGEIPNVVVYSALLNVCAKAGDYIRAERWLEIMKIQGVMPNIVCYNSLIDACAKAGCPGKAEEWLNRLCAAAQSECKSVCPGRSGRTCSGTEQLIVTRYAFVTAAQAYALKGKWQDVERIFGVMQEGGITMDEYCLTTLLSAFWRAKRPCRDLAEASIRKHKALNLNFTAPPIRVAKLVLGNDQCAKLLQELGIPDMTENHPLPKEHGIVLQ